MTRTNKAAIWLRDYLSEHGRTHSRVVRRAAKAAGHNYTIIDNARYNEVPCLITGKGSSFGTYWELP